MILLSVRACVTTVLLCLAPWSASAYYIRCPGLVLRRMGCFRVLDRWHQPIPKKLFTDSNPRSSKFSGAKLQRGRSGLSLPYIERLICRCANIATKRGFDVIGLQRYGECRSGAKARNNFAMYGPSRHCVSYRLRRCAFPNELCVGEDSSNFVFEVREDSPLALWPPRTSLFPSRNKPGFPPWRRPLPTNRRPLLPGSRPGSSGRGPFAPGTRPWPPSREPWFQFPTQKTLYPPRFPTRRPGTSFPARKQPSAIPLSSWRQPTTIPFPPMYQDDYLIRFESNTYVIAIYFVESVVSDSFLDSTPEYRGLKDREETQIKIIYQDDPTFDEVKMINVSEASFELHNRLRRWTELRRYGRILYGQDYLWPRPLYNGLYQYRYGWQYGGYGLHFDMYHGWHHHAHGWQYRHYGYYFEGPYGRIYGDYRNIWPRDELVLSFFELKFKNVGRHLQRLIANVGHWSIALCDKEKLLSRKTPKLIARIPVVSVDFQFPTNAISSLPTSTWKTLQVSIPPWRQPYPGDFPPIYQESYLEYLESTWYLIAMYFDEFVVEESFDEGSPEYLEIEKDEERQVTEIYQGDPTFEEVEIVNISKTSPELHKKLKRIMEADLYGRPLDGSLFGGNIAYGGIYGGQYGSQYPSTGPYDPYSYQARNPYGGLYGPQYGGVYGKQGPSSGKYGKQGTNTANSGRQGTGGSQATGRTQGSGAANKLKPHKKKKKKKKRVLSYFKLKFKNCGAHLKTLVKKVGYGNIARVGELVPQSYTGCCCCCNGNNVKRSLVARPVPVHLLGMPRDVLSKCSCVVDI